MTETLCKHEMIPAFCAPCRPPPPAVLTHGYRTKGGKAYHNDRECDWLRMGQRYAERKGLNTHPVEPIAWDAASPDRLQPCEACCTPDWMRRHR